MGKDAVGCVDPDECTRVCGASVGCSNIAYPKLVIELMPSGLRGLMIAVMMAALMSSLTSIFNSSSTLFTMDIWRRIRQEADEKELLMVGRIITVILVVASVVWIPILQSSNSGQLYTYIQSVTSYLAPPVTAVFLLAVFWKRANEQGAFWGLMAGLAVGLARMSLDFAHPKPRCGTPDDRPFLVKGVHYLHFAALLCLLTAAVVAGISWMTRAPDKSQIENMTWWTLHPEQRLSPPPLSAPRSLPENSLSETAKEESQEGPDWSCVCSPTVSKSETPTAEAFGDHTPSPFWARVCCINAILLLSVNIFFYAYFA